MEPAPSPAAAPLPDLRSLGQVILSRAERAVDILIRAFHRSVSEWRYSLEPHSDRSGVSDPRIKVVLYGAYIPAGAFVDLSVESLLFQRTGMAIETYFQREEFPEEQTLERVVLKLPMSKVGVNLSMDAGEPVQGAAAGGDQVLPWLD